MATPDPNAKAPRPKHMSDEDEPRPDMDHPPPARHGTATAFDRGTAEADRAARTGTLPGSKDGNSNPRKGKTSK